jgi:hypothetical protein
LQLRFLTINWQERGITNTQQREAASTIADSIFYVLYQITQVTPSIN